MAVDPAQVAQLAQLLTQTVGGDTQAMKNATQQLRDAEVVAGFGLILLELLRAGDMQDQARLAGAIYFKNYIKRQWHSEGAAGGISVADRQTIKQHLLRLMLSAPKQVSTQLAAGLQEIALTDYPAEWQDLMPEIVGFLKSSADMKVLLGTMKTANTVLLKYRGEARSDTVLRELKYTVELFQQTHLDIFKGACQQALVCAQPAQLLEHFELLDSAVNSYYSLCVIDLPEFFEDHREEYFKGFIEILQFNNEAVDQDGLLGRVKGAVCECFALWADKYQEEFEPYLARCVEALYSLLDGLGQQDRHDQLVTKGIRFLSSAAGTKWNQSPFESEHVLKSICERVVFPNIILRDSDVELFEDNPLDFVRRDMEAADQETRRRSTMDLVKALGRLHEAQVTVILRGGMNALEGAQVNGGAQAERYKDACVTLFIAMTVRGQLQREGVTVINPNVNVSEFFGKMIVPALQAEPLDKFVLLRASCLKFITMFRNLLSAQEIGAILPAICKHVTAPAPVVHTYAAICVEKLLTVRDKNPQGHWVSRYDPAAMRPNLLPMVEPILQIIAGNRGIPQNEYLMRAVSRIFSFLKNQATDAGLAVLRPLSQLLMANAANPMNPVFNHNLFEAIASIVKVTVPSHPDNVEGALLPSLGQILEQNVVDFLPYTLQILGLLLDATPSVKPLYTQLFTRLLTVDLWKAQGNVPGLLRIFRAYFAKHTVFKELLTMNMQILLERFQFLLLNKRTETSAVDLLNSMYANLPVDIYQQYFKTLVTVLLSRLHTTKSPKFKKDVIISLSLFSHRDPNNALPKVLNEIQAGLAVQLLSHVWLPLLPSCNKLDERKVCTVGLAKFMAIDEIRQNPLVFGDCCVALVSLCGLLPTSGQLLEEDSDDEAPENGGAGLEFEVTFSRLRNTDLPGAAAGLAPDIPNLHAAAQTVMRPMMPAVLQLAQTRAELQPLAALLQR
uniref:Importin N-terminal domain-containing protein n=1 Tax=Noctiluca scintillans TaxID=2966 RepID=A0A7S1A9R5_NOCSC|mmetsp:Transcript_37614/g.100039  ORF Transcript_37614/g.100039 Transcript_37614/m.100039 type:complete len:957 (+) Transcript_37614:94-2964(+)